MDARLLCKLPPLVISSAHNPGIRRYRALQEKKRRRDREQAFVVEGEQEIRYALKGGYAPELIFYPQKRTLPDDIRAASKTLVAVEESLFDSLTYRGSAAGLAAIFRQRQETAEIIAPKKILILEDVEKPGNLGALFRTALSAGCDALITTGKSTDFYNPNCIRSSVGTVFLLPHLHMSNEDCLNWLQKKGLAVFTTSLDATHDLYATPLPERSAFVFGSEHAGISSFWRNSNISSLHIPMQAEIDSLNLSASATIVLYEHLRQHRK